MEDNQGASLPWNLGRLKGFSILILNFDNQGTSQPQSEWKVTIRLLYLKTWGDWEASLSQSWIVATKGLFCLDLNGRSRRGLCTSEVGAIERLLYLNLKLWQPRGFSTSIRMEGNEVACLPRNLGWLIGLSIILILNCDDQGASLPQSKWKVTKGFVYLGTWGDW